ncbi:hypothetical protein AB0C90_21170 [Streptomyces sp. NPDC048550]|uniref:hypothetical protein n=1 Tax=unclassified Streptomyces TaxID=2593676 RepID=UPI00341A09B5
MDLVWTTLAPLVGVLLGGFMSMLAQRSAGRALERGEARRSVRELAEARRNERLTHLIEFLSAVQEAERVAVDRYHHNLADEQWQARSRQVLDRVWVTQKTIHMLCASEVSEAARSLAFAVQEVIREGPEDPGEPQDEKVWVHIHPSRKAFLDLVRGQLS